MSDSRDRGAPYCANSPAGPCRSRSRSDSRSCRRPADPRSCRSDAEDQTPDALSSIAKALTRMQDAMVTMKEKTQRTDAAVRSVAARLRAHGEVMGKLDLKMNAYEQVAVPDRATAAAAACSKGGSASVSFIDLGLLPPRLKRPTAPTGPTTPATPSTLGDATCGSIAQARICRRARSASCPAYLRPTRASQPPCPARDNLSCKAAVYLGQGTCLKESCRQPPLKPYCTCVKSLEARNRKLLRAARDGRPNYVRYLLDAGADVNYVAPLSGWTPLHRAAARAHPGVLHMLLKRGANPQLKTAMGFTPLQLAAYHDFSGRGVALLADKGADVHARTRGGKTALHFAAESGNGAAVRALKAAGASLAALDNDGRTPFALAKTPSLRRLLRVCPGRRPPATNLKMAKQSSLCDLACQTPLQL